jgi:glycosyltransferase involved in cell wall biosynthesis
LINDDASTDRTGEIVRFYEQKYPKFISKLLSNIRISILKGLNHGLIFYFQQQKAKYIALCEGDDYWNDPFKLQKQVDYLELNEKYVLSFHDRRIIDAFGNEIKDSLPYSIKKDLSFDDLTKGIFTIPTQTVVFRNIIRRFPISIFSVKNADTFLFLLLAKEGFFHFDPSIKSANYRVHDGGVWSSKNNEEIITEGFKTYKKLYAHFCKNRNLSRALFTRWLGMISVLWKKRNYQRLLIEKINILVFLFSNPFLVKLFFQKLISFFYKKTLNKK